MPVSVASQLIFQLPIFNRGPPCATSADSSNAVPVATDFVLVMNSSGFTTSVVHAEDVAPILRPLLLTAGLVAVTVPASSGFTAHTASGSTLNVWAAFAKSADPGDAVPGGLDANAGAAVANVSATTAPAIKLLCTSILSGVSTESGSRPPSRCGCHRGSRTRARR